MLKKNVQNFSYLQGYNHVSFFDQTNYHDPQLQVGEH